MPRGRKPKTAASAAEQPVEKKTRKRRAPAEGEAADSSKKFVYVFFNCDEQKSQESMNIFYNHAAYKATAAARKALWAKLNDEEAQGRIQFVDKDAAAKAVLEGAPQEASQFLRFGTIEAIPCA